MNVYTLKVGAPAWKLSLQENVHMFVIGCFVEFNNIPVKGKFGEFRLLQCGCWKLLFMLERDEQRCFSLSKTKVFEHGFNRKAFYNSAIM